MEAENGILQGLEHIHPATLHKGPHPVLMPALENVQRIHLLLSFLNLPSHKGLAEGAREGIKSQALQQPSCFP